MEYKELIAKRRSTRRFTSEEVSVEVLSEIVQEAFYAPSAKNTRTSRFLVVRDRETLQKISQMRDFGALPVAQAGAAVVVMSDASECDMWKENCSISATYILLSAVEHGLAGCWIQVDGRHTRHDDPQSSLAQDYLEEFLEIPHGCKVECVIALGYADYTPKPLPEHDDSKSVIWHNKL